MKKIKINDGDIVRFPLTKKIGYGYAKYIDLRKLPDISYPSLLKVFDYWTKDKTFDIDQIKNCTYLIQPILVAGILPTMQNGLWETVANLPLTKEDSLLNDFKTHGPPWADEKDAKKWYVIVNGNITNKTEVPFEHVKHLEKWGAQGTGSIEIRVTMQILLNEGKAVGDYFDLTNDKFNDEYQKALEIPLLSKLPKALIGKAMIG